MEDRKVYLEVTYEYKGLDFTEIMEVEAYQNLIEYVNIISIEEIDDYVK